MSKGVGKVLGIVAAIAIPFAAPAIAGAVGLSSAVTGAVGAFGLAGKVGAAVGGAVSSGLVGAGLGAANAALTGGNVGQGALLGGLGSALSGGFSAFKASGPANLGGTPGSGAGTAGAATSTSTVARVPGSWTDATGAVSYFPGGATAGASTPGLTSALTTPGVSGSAAAQGILKNIGASLGNVAPEILQKAAVFLASGALSGTSAQEKELIKQAAARMREIESQDRALYQTMLAEAQAISPEGRGMQWYNDAKLQGLAATEAAVETVNPRNQGQISEVTRAGLIDASKNATLAYSQGRESGANERRAAYGALGALPRANAALGALGLEQQRQADQAGRAAGIRSALGTVFTTDPGEADDEDLGTDNNQRTAAVKMGLGGQ